MLEALTKRIEELGTSNGEDWFFTKETLQQVADELPGETPVDESFEFTLARRGHRFVPCGKFNNDAGNYLFTFDHPQFAHCVSEVAEFVSCAWKPLLSIWKNWAKPAKKKLRKKG